MTKARDFNAADALVYLGGALGAALSWYGYGQISPVWMLWALGPVCELVAVGIFEGMGPALAWGTDEAQGRRVFSWGLILAALMLVVWIALGGLVGRLGGDFAPHALPLGNCLGLWGLWRMLRSQARLARPGAVLLSDALLGLLFLIISGVHDFLGGALESELWLAAGALLLTSLLLYVASEQPRFLAPDKDSLMYLVREGAASLPRRMAYLLPVSALMAVIALSGCFGWRITPSLLPILLITALWRLGWSEDKFSPPEYEARGGRLVLVFSLVIAVLGVLNMPSALLALWAFACLMALGRPAGGTSAKRLLPLLLMGLAALLPLDIGCRALIEAALLVIQLALARRNLYAAWLPVNALWVRSRANWK